MNCLNCKKEIVKRENEKPCVFLLRKFCNRKCANIQHKNWSVNIGKTYNKEHKIKLSILAKKRGAGKWMLGRKLSEETRNKMSNLRRGEKSSSYIKDRTKLRGYNSEERRSSAYNIWRSEVYKRDNWKCKINNLDCKGRIEAHHILGFTAYPKLRYDINNGITLCHFHHPFKREDEIRLSPYFKELLKV